MKSLIIICLLISPFVLSQNVQFVNQSMDSIHAKEIRSLFEDSKHNIWLSTKSDGIYRLKDGQLQKMISTNTSVLSGFISALEDEDGSIWFSARGVMKFKNDAVNILTEHDGVSSSVIFSISKADDDTICFSGNRGTDCISEKGIKKFNATNGLKHQVVHDAKKDTLGQFWFATRKGGLNMVDDKGKWHYFLEGVNCRKLLKLKNGNLWIGTSTGAILLNINTHTFTIIEKGFALIPQLESQDESVVFATEGHGVFVYAQQTWKQFNAENSILKCNVVHTIIEDVNQTLWMGFDKGFQVIKPSELYGN
ncbi:hypothetical protein [uncultured Winogradskyella sp.]|uniref:hypothetical protein n=1 Tax=uncultured Winogradskyella sp. TaxID=395353 RepID=UPI00261CD9FD|nr:hypothetical protein [uncultured Winogradskyella sp.]